jgi:hypothetical protein
MDTFDLIESEGNEYCKNRQIGPVCISVTYVEAATVVLFDGTVRSFPAGYLPTLSTDEWGDAPPSSGVPMATIDLATEAAYALVPLHLDALARSFRPFGHGADEICVVEV